MWGFKISFTFFSAASSFCPSLLSTSPSASSTICTSVFTYNMTAKGSPAWAAEENRRFSFMDDESTQTSAVMLIPDLSILVWYLLQACHFRTDSTENNSAHLRRDMLLA